MFQFTRRPRAVSFETICREVKHCTVLEPTRLWYLYDLCARVANLDGAVAELGVFRGGVLRLLTRRLPHKDIHGFDTFEGMPLTWTAELDGDYWTPASRAFATQFVLDSQGEIVRDAQDAPVQVPLETQVRTYLADCPNVQLHAGVFPESVPAALTDEKFCFLHFDGDLYRSCMDALAFFYPRLVPGGIIVFDDYGRPQCPGVKRGIDDFFGGKIALHHYEPHSVAYLQK